MYVEDRGLGDFLGRIVEERTRDSPVSHDPGSHQLTTMDGRMTLVMEHFDDLGPTNDFRVESRSETTVTGQRQP